MPYNELIKLKNAFSQLNAIDQNLKMRHLKAHLTLARIKIYATNMVRKTLMHQMLGICYSATLCTQLHKLPLKKPNLSSI